LKAQQCRVIGYVGLWFLLSVLSGTGLEVSAQDKDQSMASAAAQAQTKNQSARKTPWEQKVDKYVQGLPVPAKALILRMDGCQHWAGEEPTSEARATQIEKAMKELKCDGIDNEKSQILKKYKSQTKITKKISEFPQALE
jgi:hypothetical protein